jgi:glycosyltransferase involved in cell wall biosynthesis
MTLCSTAPSTAPHPVELPSISVIIPIYNAEADLPDLLRCLQQQDYPATQVEYLLVDNNSQDRTSELLQALPQETPFRSLREAEIQSSYAARNRGIRAANGEILVFTDADCRPQPGWLRQIVQPFLDAVTGPKLGIVAGEIAALPGDSLLERFADRQAVLSQKHTLAHPFLPYGQTANLAVRRAIFDQVGLFRPYLTTGGDADLCWRILQQGWRIASAEQAVVLHRHRSTLADLRSQWRRYGRSNRYLHELHGVSLAQEPTWQVSVYRWSRWLLKEVPIALITGFIKVNGNKAGLSAWIDAMVETPLTLLCQQARAQGQRQAHLPEAAKEIAWLPSSCGLLATPTE